MDRIQRHLNIISFEALAILVGCAIVTAVFMPKKYGFYGSVFLMTSWLNLNRFEDLRLIASITKATYWLPPMLLIFFATFLPGPRRRVPPLAWLYLLCSMFGSVCVLAAVDSMHGVVQFSAMFLYAAAAIACFRVANTSQEMVRVVAILSLGTLVPLAIALTSLVIHRGAAFRAGLGRFEPFGMSANQYGHLLATACCFAGCGYITLRGMWMKLSCLGVIGACGAMLVTSGSRQGLFIMVVAMIPLILWGAKRPVVLAISIMCLLGVGAWVFSFASDVQVTDRITQMKDTSGRLEINKKYFDVFLTRPLGLLGTRGKSVNLDPDVGNISHNSYMRMLYVGGVPLAFPLFAVWLASVSSTVYVLKNKHRAPINPVMLSFFAFLLLAIYFHGLVNDMIYISISSWTFLHFFLSIYFLATASEMKNNLLLPWQFRPFQSGHLDVR